MRVFMVAGVAAMVLTLSVGCADKGGVTDAAASAAVTSAAASPSAAGGDAACDPIKALQVQYFDKVLAELQKAMQASQSHDTAGGIAAVTNAEKLVTEWASKLEPLAGQATNAELKSATTHFVEQLKLFSTDKTGKIAQIQTAGPAFTSVLLKVCP
jgi:hypothetical protein